MGKKLLAFTLASALPAYSLAQTIKVQSAREIKAGAESITCQYTYHNLGQARPATSVYYIFVSKDNGGSTMHFIDKDADRRLDLLTIYQDTADQKGKYTNYDRDKMGGNIKALDEYQPTFEKYLSMFGPECGVK